MKMNIVRRARFAGACVFAACALAACKDDYRESAPEPVFNQALTDALRQSAAKFPQSAISRQVRRVDCYVGNDLSSDMLRCDVTIAVDNAGTQTSKFEAGQSLQTPMVANPRWWLNTDALRDTKFRLVIEQRAPDGPIVLVHADPSRVSLDDAQHVVDSAVSAVNSYLHNHPDADPQALRDTWTSPSSDVHTETNGPDGAASAASAAGGRP
ncbi:hypothetical protein QZM82_31910 [Burkholderia cepacia]|uniref:hypothetical protein n=1 Tax=Burkholderia cepacia TaxID=292 RepID=UPI0026514837|nr:hypothetical protein [Burkholderia cepacia]MDN7900806.1 hypothetical protein [Burkholderia cepacia]